MAGKMPMNGAPGEMGLPNFDFSALQNVLNDPSIKQMAEQIAQDPAFAQMTAALQASVAGDEAGASGVDGKAGDVPAGGPGGLPTMDAEKYAQAMSNVLQNQHFMEMAEKLGQQIMSDPGMSQMMQTMHDPAYREKIEKKMAELKGDPELSSIMQELEGGGPAAMMKYWDNPKVLEKLSGAMGDAFNADGAEVGVHGEEAGDEEDEPVDNSVHGAASSGDAAALKQLLEAGADKDEQDEEGRTALHFACGYGEMACVDALLEAKANLDAIDHNKNTALHYAAGYGQPEVVELLLKHGANSTAKNVDGKTAKDVAELNNQTDVVECFNNDKASS